MLNDIGGGGFDSSILNPGQTYSFNFAYVYGHYTYHSATEPVHMYTKDGMATVGWPFNGTIDVRP